jgi:predicted P-loop ATPase
VDWHAKNQPTWDGEPRIDTWLIKYGGADDTKFNRMAGRLTLIAAVRRAREPGSKHDEMLVLISEQGTNKSSALAVLAVRQDWFTDNFPLHSKDKEIIEHLQGRWIIECGELAGMKQAQIEEIKVLLSKQKDTARLSYKHLPETVYRRCIFIGSTNSSHFLRDIQNRRFWPVRIQRFDVEALRADVAQLWAEAAHYESIGESVQLPEEYWPLATEAQEEHEQEEPWVTALADALGDLEGRIITEELWKILGKPVERRQAVDSARLGDAMQKLKWSRKQFRFPGRKIPVRGWCKGEPPYAALYVSQHEDGTCTVMEAPNAGQYESAISPGAAPEVDRTAPF